MKSGLSAAVEFPRLPRPWAGSLIASGLFYSGPTFSQFIRGDSQAIWPRWVWTDVVPVIVLEKAARESLKQPPSRQRRHWCRFR